MCWSYAYKQLVRWPRYVERARKGAVALELDQEPFVQTQLDQVEGLLDATGCGHDLSAHSKVPWQPWQSRQFWQSRQSRQAVVFTFIDGKRHGPLKPLPA